MAGRKKAANGRGTVFWHAAKGRWCAQLSVDGGRLSRYFPTEMAAYDWLDEERPKARRGELTANILRLRVAEVLERWLESVEARRRPKTLATYRRVVEHFLLPALGRRKLQDLRWEHVEGLYDDLRARGYLWGKRQERREYSRSTIHQVHRTLRTALRWAKRKKLLLGENPMDAVDPPAPGDARKGHWSAEQARAFLTQVRGHRLEALYVLAIALGLRPGELLGLRWGDLDLRHGRLTVRQQLQDLEDAGMVPGQPKTERGERLLLLQLISRPKWPSRESETTDVQLPGV